MHRPNDRLLPLPLHCKSQICFGSTDGYGYGGTTKEAPLEYDFGLLSLPEWLGM